MTTILLLNAASSLLAAIGIGAFIVRKRRQAVVQPIYLTTRRPRSG